jgi:hypothetical protein
MRETMKFLTIVLSLGLLITACGEYAAKGAVKALLLVQLLVQLAVSSVHLYLVVILLNQQREALSMAVRLVLRPVR